MSTVYFDIEADGLIPEKLKRITLGISYSEVDGYRKWTDEEELVNYLLCHREIVAHNGIGYDFPALRALTGRLPSVFDGTHTLTDTLVLSRMCYPEFSEGGGGGHSLEEWGNRMKMPKGDFKGPWDVLTPEMEEYCRQDVAILVELHKSLQDHPSNSEAFRVNEHEVAELIHLQETNGVCFDKEAGLHLVHLLNKRKQEIEDEVLKLFPSRFEEMKTPAYWFVGDLQFPTKGAAKKAGYKEKDISKGPNRIKEIPFNPGSRQQIAERLMEKGWKPTKFTETGKPQMDEGVLEEIPFPEAKALNELFLVDKKLGMVINGDNAWFRFLQDDGRIYGRVNPLGARTTRMSHYKPNLAQVPKVDNPFGPECRQCFTAREGWLMVGADAAGIDGRVFAHYMSIWDGGEYIRLITEGDIHSLNQQTWGLAKRGDAKPPYYALLYGAQPAKLGLLVGGGHREGQQILSKFEKRHPAFRLLTEVCVEKHNERGWVKGLDGRRLTTDSPHSALNTLVQGGAAIVLKYALTRFYRECVKLYGPHGQRWAFCLNVHDEVQIESEPDIAEPIGKLFVESITWAGVHLKVRCPLTGAYMVGKNWKETH